MKLLIFLPLLFLCFLQIQSYQTPGVEVLILIKATNNSVDQTYFTFTIIPFVLKLSNQFVLTNDLSETKTEFARIAVNIGGTDEWASTSLQNVTCNELNLELMILDLPNVNNTKNEGSSAAIESAVKTFYNSSVAVTRIVVLLTDEVVPADLDSPFVKTFSAISGAIFVVGIPSVENPSFNNSMEYAQKLATNSIIVYPSIDDASGRFLNIFQILFMLGQSPVRTCRRIAFLYENSIYVNSTAQTNFASFVNNSIVSFASNDGVTLTSFEDVLNDLFVFLQSNEMSLLNVEPSDSFDPLNYTISNNIYAKLVELSHRPDTQHLDIVLLTQSDVYDSNITDSMSELAKQPNVNVFVFDVSENSTNNETFGPLTNDRFDRIFNVQNADANDLAQLYAEKIYPTISLQDCQIVPIETSTETPIISTTQKFVTTTNSGSQTSVSLVFGAIVALFAMIFI